jgi:hypothetical protein
LDFQAVIGGGEGSSSSCGTLTRDEWEALTIYTVFAFKKIKEISSP